jgi:hypothetical protein
VAKHILKVAARWDIDSTKDGVGEALGADYKKVIELIQNTRKITRISETIETIMFDNNEPIQTRILAVYLAGIIYAKKSTDGSNFSNW